MAETHTRKLLDDRINILDRNATDPSPARHVFETVSAILALTRDEMMNDKDSVKLSEYCFDVCSVLETAIRGKKADDLSGPVRTALEDLERLLCEIERTLRSGVNPPHTKYDKEKVEEHKLEIREILDVFNPRSPPFGEYFGMIGSPTLVVPAVSAAESACQRLIKRTFAPKELPPLIETIFSSPGVEDMIHRFCVDDAQAFIDVIDEALVDLPDLSPPIRKKCLKSLYRACGRHSLIPRALKVPICYDRNGHALYKGGSADVWKGEHCGRDVAVKVLRVYSTGELQKLIDRFCKEVVTLKALQHPNVLPLIGVIMTETQFAMVSEWMANGSINEFVKTNPDANRLGLLGGVARGLIYIHSQGMIHGDLKGANILIDQTGNARLADFGLLTVISDPANLLPSSSYTQGGTARWMSPELIDPQKFGFEKSRPTKCSDCYALGMVIYETISGHLPFHHHADLTVFVKVLAGERPPRGAVFTESLWKMLELCWTPEPNNRPSIEDVLQCLQGALDLSEPLSPWVDEPMEVDSNDCGAMGYGNPTTPMAGQLSIPHDGTFDPPLLTGGNHEPFPQHNPPSILSVSTEVEMSYSKDEAPTLVVIYAAPYAVRMNSCICGCGRGPCIPQREYERPRTDPLSPRELQEMVLFSVNGKCGYPLKDALKKNYTGLDGKDDKMFPECKSSVSLRLEWLPYEKWTRQIRALTDWRKDPDHISRAKLATGVAKRMKAFIEEIQTKEPNPSYREYRVESGIIDLHLELVALKRVSKSSWMPY